MPYYGPKRPINITRQGKQGIDTIFYHLPTIQFYTTKVAKQWTNRTLFDKVWIAGFTSFSGKDAPALAVVMNRTERTYQPGYCTKR